MSLIALTTDPPADGEPTLADPDLLGAVVEFIPEARGHLSAVEVAVRTAGRDSTGRGAVDAAFRGFHTIKGVASFLGLESIVALAHAAEGLLEAARRGRLRLAGGTADLVLTAVDAMRELVDGLERAARAREPLASPPGLEDLVLRLTAHAAQAAAAASEPRADVPALADSSSSRTVKVAADRPADAIGKLSDEAKSLRGMDMATLGPNDPRIAGNPARIGPFTRDLPGPSAPAGTVPLQSAFERMARVLRDLCRRTGKEIDLEIEGGETEADRAVVDAIAEPLVHMVRNAADHGIEPAEARELAGKLRAGRITLRAYHQAGTVVIEISDDGRGLRKEQIVAKAIELGVVRPDEADGLTEQQVFHLIFNPGLSTAYAVTEISGRGVGMDVVKHDIDALNGQIEIASKEKVGTTFTIRLPLTTVARAA